MNIEERKKVEASFHDQRAIDRLQKGSGEFEAIYANKKYYTITRAHRIRIDRWIASYCRGAVVLDYCCGEGETTAKLCQPGATVFGVDISAESLVVARRTCAHIANPPNFVVGDAEALAFPDSYFDAILVSGCLHHLDLEKAYRELHRVLKPNGRIMCNEAMAHNPIFHFYRKLTPKLRTPWEVPHILRMRDIRKADNFFEGNDVHFHYLFSLFAVPFRRTRFFLPMLNVLELVDRIALSIPGFRLMAWQTTFELSRPKGK
jgi:SAM-dependent methyltransferase